MYRWWNQIGFWTPVGMTIPVINRGGNAMISDFNWVDDPRGFIDRVVDPGY
ncbi:hypothetical protein [Brevibacillus laterosporus]|uniref:hypothetical protein n=1 Tax=Brevibacillus laterosporus TaxID=1465 RepID=UPI0018CF6A3F|nr:hypothetical protein [Brevibacillus laterosporus]